VRGPRGGVRILVATAAATAVAVGLLYPTGASAHALVGRQDLPIPEWLFAWAASLVLIVSFVGLTVAWRKPRLQDRDWRPAPEWLSRALVNPVAEVIAGAIGVFLLGFTIYAGLAGTDAPDRNFSLTFVFVTFWLGMVVLSVLFGNVFRAFNPWRAIGRVAGSGFRLVAGQEAPHAAYPQRLGRWPAVAGLAAFFWLELVYGLSGFSTPGLTPSSVSTAIVLYSVLTFVAMGVFGTERWTRSGETFSVYMEMFSRLSKIEVRDGRLGIRRWLTGLNDWVSEPGSVALVLVSIGGTTFDGAQEGTLKNPISTTFNFMLDHGIGSTTALRVTSTLFLALTILFVSGIFWLGISRMRTVSGSHSTAELGRQFGHAFVPIALAYLVAHYFSLFAFQEQAQFTYLLSDPLGDGSNLFGTAATQINYGLIGATAVWYVQVGALVVGHVIALAVGHDRAISLYGDPKLAARSQYWMLALMVGFTSLGLFLLSQSNQ
jgi:hypothetical protein